ncbi:MAG: polyphosphate polymerase domain-containing protein [Planctomycetota bacterium]
MSHELNSLETLQSAAKYGSRGAYEIKFLLHGEQSHAVREWARANLQPDPHSTPELEHGYCVNSLYLDTPAFDVFHRTDNFRQRKYRLRRYGSESVVWMELKRKHNGRVRKRRTPIVDADLPSRLLSVEDPDWEGSWFRRRLDELQLRPVCQVTYQRFACVGTSLYGPVRLTVDSQLHCQPANGWQVPAQPLTSGLLLQDQQILELKFRETIPHVFRDLIQELRLGMASFSKYRQGVEACVSLDRLMGATPGT